MLKNMDAQKTGRNSGITVLNVKDILFVWIQLKV
jgi:hypothetical protein